MMISNSYQAKKKQLDKLFRILFLCAGLLSALFILLIFFFISLKGIQPFLPNYQFTQQNFIKFIIGLTWNQARNEYGVLFIIINTLISATGAVLIAFPIAVLSALFITKSAPTFLSKIFETIIELLAAIPSVIYGVFASGVITKWVHSLAISLNQPSWGGNSLLTVILLLAIMIYPTITILSITAIKAVPPVIEQGSLALGASQTQTNFKVILVSAKSGIFAGLILGLGRAFGEATAVSMVAGNKLFGPTFNPFDITRTLTSTMLAGLKETSGLDYDIRFSVGIVLLIIIFITNMSINSIKRRIGQPS